MQSEPQNCLFFYLFEEFDPQSYGVAYKKNVYSIRIVGYERPVYFISKVSS